MADGFKPSTDFTVGFDDDPRCIGRMCFAEHFFLILGVELPMLLRLVIDRADLPLFQWIFLAGLKPTILFFL